MTQNEIARAIINRPNKGSNLVAQSDARQMLGEDGYQEAIRRGWLIPDDTGYLAISERADARDEIRSLSEDATGRTFRQGTLKVVGVQNDPTTNRPVSFLVKNTAQENDPAAPQTNMAVAALSAQDKTELGIV